MSGDGQQGQQDQQDKRSSPSSVLIAPLVAGGVALGSGVTGLAVTGTIGRVQRNHPQWFTASVGLAVVAGACWLFSVLVAQATREEQMAWWKRPVYFWEWTKKPWMILGIFAAVVGVLIGFFVSISSVSEAERPRVSVSIDPDTLLLTGTAKVSHLSSKEPLTVSVEGMVYRHGVLRWRRRLAEASVGPDGDGDATQDLSVRIPPGRYDVVGVSATIKDDNQPADKCGTYPTAPKATQTVPAATQTAPAAAKVLPVTTTASGERESKAKAVPPLKSPKPDEGTGCIYMPLPTRGQRPRIDAHYVDAARQQLAVSVAAPNLATAGVTRPFVHLDATGWDGAGIVTLGRQVREADGPGTGARTLTLAVPRNVRRVCLRAWLTPRSELGKRVTCPLRPHVNGSTMELIGPRYAKPMPKAKAKKKT
ncbi:MAG: hypothetical protein JWR63_4250 [Conexibacter sp.]|nr:hypothetical protein [Conexibacter sp.]